VNFFRAFLEPACFQSTDHMLHMIFGELLHLSDLE
jgi:hypothetical protein